MTLLSKLDSSAASPEQAAGWASTTILALFSRESNIGSGLTR